MADVRGTVDAAAIGRFLLRGTRRAAVSLVGFGLVAVGVAGLLLPILPGWALIIAGLLLLSREYSWAHAALAFARRHTARGGASLRSMAAPPLRRRMGNRPSKELVIDLTQSGHQQAGPASEEGADASEDADEVSATG